MVIGKLFSFLKRPPSLKLTVRPYLIGLPKRKLVFQTSFFRGNVSFKEGIFRVFAVSSRELICLRMRGKGQDPVQEIRSDIWWPLVGRGFSNSLPKYTHLGTNVLLMEEILHQLIGSLSHNLRVFYIPGGAGFHQDFFHQQYSLLKILLKMFSFSLGGICSFFWRVPIDNQGDLQTCSALVSYISFLGYNDR